MHSGEYSQRYARCTDACKIGFQQKLAWVSYREARYQCVAPPALFALHNQKYICMRRTWIVCSFVAGMLFALGCAEESPPPPAESQESIAESFTPETAADSLALRVYEAHGGDAWEQAPYLRFDFGVAQGEAVDVVARHLWDRENGQYRVEWDNNGTRWVAILDLHSAEDPPDGRVFEDGEPVVGEAAQEPLGQAYQRYINDTYWLLAPLKVLDDGVRRSIDAEASTEEQAVLHLSFGEVGLTPGDEYWLYIDRDTHRITKWAFHLQNMEEDDEPRAFAWTDAATFERPEGTIYLHARKQSQSQQMAIVMPTLDVPDTVDSALFEDGTPGLLE